MLMQVDVGTTNIYDASGVMEIKVIFKPTPIWCGVKDTITNYNNFNGSILLLTTSDGVTIGTTIMIIDKGRGMNFELVPSLIGLASVVVTIDCSPWCLDPKVDDDVALGAFVLASNL